MSPDKTKLKAIKEKIENYDMLLKMFKMEILDYREGYSKVKMEIKENHTNAAGVCHGGVIFSLADVAFALASNSHGTVALAIEGNISFIGAVKPGTTITAICTEKHLGRSTGIYITEIFDNKNKLISLMKATAFRFEKSLLNQ